MPGRCQEAGEVAGHRVITDVKGKFALAHKRICPVRVSRSGPVKAGRYIKHDAAREFFWEGAGEIVGASVETPEVPEEGCCSIGGSGEGSTACTHHY